MASAEIVVKEVWRARQKPQRLLAVDIKLDTEDTFFAQPEVEKTVSWVPTWDQLVLLVSKALEVEKANGGDVEKLRGRILEGCK